MKLKCKKEKLCPVRIESRPSLVASMHAPQPLYFQIEYCTICRFWQEGFSPALHKKLGQFPGWTCDNAQVEPGKYTSNCRELKAGTIPWYKSEKPCYSRDLSWEYISLLQCIAGNVPSYNAVYYQASKCFYHIVHFMLYHGNFDYFLDSVLVFFLSL